MVVLDEKAPDAATAVSQAWTTYKPGFARPLRESVNEPDHDGWTGLKAFVYGHLPTRRHSCQPLLSARETTGQWCFWMVPKRRLRSATLSSG